MAVVFTLRMIKSLEMSIDLQMLSNFKSERFFYKLEFVNVAIVIDGRFFDDLKFCLNGL